MSSNSTLLCPNGGFDLSGTLTSGQAFRWQPEAGAWTGVIARKWVRLTAVQKGILAETAEPVEGWDWLTHYLQTHVDLSKVLESFPDDEPMRQARAHGQGLRLLRQEPWECLASFILSSTKRIVQIQQAIGLLSLRYGDPLPHLASKGPVHAFPSPVRIAQTTETELRECKVGFRAPYLLSAARAVEAGHLDLEGLRLQSTEKARERLTSLVGVGPKIADCVLLFAYGFQDAFPVDVWVQKALSQLYFPGRKRSPDQLKRFAGSHFGPHAGYAQQYLFHYMRTRPGANQVKPARR